MAESQPPFDYFSLVLTLATRRADGGPGEEPAAAIAAAITKLHGAMTPFQVADLQVAYNENPPETLELYTERAGTIYESAQELSDATARLLDTVHAPALGETTLAGLSATVHKQHHPLEPALTSRAREIELLSWICEVSDVAVRDHVPSDGDELNATILRDGFVMARSPEPPAPVDVRKAKNYLTGLNRKYGTSIDPGDGAHVAIAYVDLASHTIFRDAPGMADPARKIVMDAGVHHIVVSRAVLDNIAWAAARLIELTPDPAAEPAVDAGASAVV
jgi:hypothetical protein